MNLNSLSGEATFSSLLNVICECYDNSCNVISANKTSESNSENTMLRYDSLLSCISEPMKINFDFHNAIAFLI